VFFLDFKNDHIEVADEKIDPKITVTR